MICVMMVLALYLTNRSWIFARPLSDLTLYEKRGSVPEVPVDAVRFSVNHGEFTFYSDSPKTNPTRTILVVGAAAGASFLFMLLSLSEFAGGSGKIDDQNQRR